MPFNVTPLEDKIVSAKPAELSHAEEVYILEAVRAKVAGKPIASPFNLFSLTYSKSMLPIILILALTLGASGTVAASDGARPGDILFPIDRAIEDFRISVAGDEEKQELRIKFADERLREFDEIAGDDDDDLEGTLTEAEADIFTDETVVKLEAGDRKVTFVTDANTREEIIDVIHDQYGFAKADIDAVLSVDTEDRESTSEDRDEDENERERLEKALDALGDFIEENRTAASSSPEVLTALALIESRILDRSAFFPEEIRVKVRDDRARYEVRGENGERVRVEFKDGEVRIKTKDGDDDDRDEDEDEDRNDDDDREEDEDRDEDEGLEIEADIFTDITTVEVELNDRTTSFTTDADTREEIIDAIQARFPNLSESEIDAALDLEVEDRASREDDRDEDEDDSEGRDDDEDEDREDEEELEIEAEVHSSSSSVEVEINGVKTRFSTTATTRAGIIDAIESRFPALSESEIDAALELEFDDEDEDDEDEDEEDEEDEDDEDEDDDEDEEDEDEDDN